MNGSVAMMVGPHVERSAVSPGDPVSFQPYQFAHLLHEQVRIYSGNAQPRARLVESGDVHVGSKEQYIVFLEPGERLQALENLLPVMQHHGRGMQDKIVQRRDFGGLPATLIRRKFHLKHALSENSAKSELVLVIFG